MTHRTFLFSVAIITGWLTTAPANAQTIYFADDFEEATDSTTFLGNVSLGGDPDGDADPNSPQAGFWDTISENPPYRIQVTQGMTGPGPATPGPGPASGVNALVLERLFPGFSEIRGDFEEVATGQVSVEFDLWVNYGQAQFFPRNGTLGGYDGYPILINLTATGQAQIDNGPLTAPFYVSDTGTGPADIDYNHVEIVIDLNAQRFSLSVDGATLPELTNRAFATNGAGGTQPVTQLQQVAFGEPTGNGVYYIDNLIVQTAVPSTDNADFDGDNDVDGADFLIWQRGVGNMSADLEDGDANDDNSVDGLDLDIWRTEFGMPQTQVATSAIPEPSGLGLLALGSGALALVGRCTVERARKRS